MTNLLRSPLQNLCILGNFLIRSFTDLFDVPLHSLHLQFNLLFLNPINSHPDSIFFLSMHVLQSLLLISDKLSTRFDNLLDINLQVSINFILYVIVSPLSLSRSFLIGTEKLIYFSVFSPKHVNLSLNSSANSWIIKW